MLAKDDEIRIAARNRKPVSKPFFSLDAGHIELVTSYPGDAISSR